ncbi:MAG: hypothetical protein ACYSU1_05335, partial [Planctomycetota bacterium]
SVLLLGVLAACGKEEVSDPLEVLSWSGSDGSLVSMDHVLKVEFNQALATPFRSSCVELLDEREHVIEGVEVAVIGRWLHLTPRLPLRADLEDGSLSPDRSYTIRLYGLPWLRALSSVQGNVLERDRFLGFRTLSAQSPGALTGLGVESSSLRLLGPTGMESWSFEVGHPVILPFSRGLDPRTLSLDATWRDQGAGEGRAVGIQLVENRFDGASLEVLLGEWRGWGVLELPEGIEGLGGWPLPVGDRSLRLVQRGKVEDPN